MELIRGLVNLRPRHRGCVATIGAFDGVHLGHQAVMGQLLRAAKAHDLPSAVILFEPLPAEYFAPLQSPARLMTLREKYLAISALGIDRLLCLRFNPQLQQMGARRFVERVFIDGLGIKHAVIGDDFRFGNDRQGDLALIRDIGAKQGFSAEPTDTVEMDGQRVSSTRIREALAVADFAQAERLLGRAFTMSGKVVYGRQLGRSLGFPTANIELCRLRAPLSGVFAVRLAVDGEAEVYCGVANIGTRPTVNESIKANLEVHLLDVNRNIYGRRVTVSFCQKLRDEQKFASIEALQTQIGIDSDQSRAYFAACE